MSFPIHLAGPSGSSGSGTTTGAVDLSGGWNTLWGAISGAIGGTVTTILTIIGVILVVASAIGYLWNRRRGGSAAQGLDRVIWMLIIGAVLAAPSLIIPMLLSLLDLLINAIIKLAQGAGL